jgi:hypothetical protein
MKGRYWPGPAIRLDGNCGAVVRQLAVIPQIFALHNLDCSAQYVVSEFDGVADGQDPGSIHTLGD